MPGELQCKTRLDTNPKLRKDYTSFFYDQDYDYKYYFYMRELKRKIKRKEIYKYDDDENDLEYKDLFDKQRKPKSVCKGAISFMMKVMTCLMAYNMYNNFNSQNFGVNLNRTFFSRI